MNKPWQASSDHLRLSVRLTPNGGRDAIDGVETGSDGECYLKARVSVGPEKGKANRELRRMLAEFFGVAQNNVEIISGDSSQHKRLRISR